MKSLFFLLVIAACAPKAPAPAAADPPKAPSSSSSSSSSSSTTIAQRAFVTIHTEQGPLRYAVELAIKEAERNQGLMYREHMADDVGMLFIFEKQRIQSFWMKNTKIPLDMIFIAEDGTIAGIVENAEPMTLTSRKTDKASRYVLELNGGMSRRMGIKAGQRVHFEGVQAELVDARVLAP